MNLEGKKAVKDLIYLLMMFFCVGCTYIYNIYDILIELKI